MKAKDIMEPVKETLTPETTLKEAVNSMRVARRGDGRVGVKGMIVLDNGKLAGIISIKDILKAIIPSYMTLTELGEFTWDGMLEQMAKKVADRKVEEIMTRNVITVSEDAPLMECADLVVKHGLHRLPVLDRDKKVVGMVYIRDLYQAIVQALFEKGGKR
ncbi:inosine 5'-monophosphate dehydrogenase [bacterium BMS3Bbin07]|nr:inosine 5'-monophosphate dehydrogenase [bacterium BMS3Bbin07]HDH02014.1 CBS domain-containing protein [Nitrospirota bacterium]